MTLIRQSKGPNPLRGFQVNPALIGRIGTGLQRPECILAERDGTVWCADACGGVVRIAPNGEQKLISQTPTRHFDRHSSTAGSLLYGTLPNGLAFAENGDLLISNFGNDRLERMTRSGETTIMLDSIGGEPLGKKVNFVLRDSRDRIWITISTMINPWNAAINPTLADGRIILIDDKGRRIVADGFQFANEIRFDIREEWLYVAETTGKRISRLRVAQDGSLSDREVYGPCDLGSGLVDGIAFDAFGNLWATMVFADRLIAITPEGDVLQLLEDGNPVATACFEHEFVSLTSVHLETLMRCGGQICTWLASVTFGGPDLSTVYLGGLRTTSIPFFRSPSAGQPMIHW